MLVCNKLGLKVLSLLGGRGEWGGEGTGYVQPFTIQYHFCTTLQKSRKRGNTAYVYIYIGVTKISGLPPWPHKNTCTPMYMYILYHACTLYCYRTFQLHNHAFTYEISPACHYWQHALCCTQSPHTKMHVYCDNVQLCFQTQIMIKDSW